MCLLPNEQRSIRANAVPAGRQEVFFRPDGAPSMRQFEELQHPIRQHDKFRSVVVRVQPPGAHRITIDLRSAAEAGSVLIAKRFAVLVLIAHSRLTRLRDPFDSDIADKPSIREEEVSKAVRHYGR